MIKRGGVCFWSLHFSLFLESLNRETMYILTYISRQNENKYIRWSNIRQHYLKKHVRFLHMSTCIHPCNFGTEGSVLLLKIKISKYCKPSVNKWEPHISYTANLNYHSLAAAYLHTWTEHFPLQAASALI